MSDDEKSDYQPEDVRLVMEQRVARLNEAVDSAPGTRQQISAHAGISVTTLKTYLDGGEWKLAIAERIAEACGVSPRWLIFGDIDAPQPHRMTQSQTIAPIVPSNIVTVPYYDVEASAGFGRFATDTTSAEQFPISMEMLTELSLSPKQTIVLRVAGDSMEPTLGDGDRLIVNTTPVSMLSGVLVLVAHGQLMVKRLAVTASGRVRIISDNKSYPPEEEPVTKFRSGQPDDDDSITVIGRVVCRIQALS